MNKIILVNGKLFRNRCLLNLSVGFCYIRPVSIICVQWQDVNQNLSIQHLDEFGMKRKLRGKHGF